MSEKEERLKDIKAENLTGFIYILSWYTNSKEKRFVLYKDKNVKKNIKNQWF